jgi:hypothetical protein
MDEDHGGKNKIMLFPADIEAKNFESFYSLKLQALLKDLKMKGKVAARWGIIAIAAGVLAILFFIGNISGYIETSGIIAGAFTLLCIVSIYFYTTAKDWYVDNFKQTVIREIISYLHPGILYTPSKFISSKEYKTSGLFMHRYDYYDGDDYLQGVYKNVSFHCSELHTQYDRTVGPMANYETTIFKGLFFVADLNINLWGNTYIWNRGEEQTGSSIAEKHYKYMPLPQVYKVKSDNSSFDKIFSIYSTNPNEAKAILNMEMTDRMVRFKTQINRDIVFSIVGGKFYAAVSFDEDLLEPSVTNADDKEQIKQFFFTILLILSIINQLRLDKFA